MNVLRDLITRKTLAVPAILTVGSISGWLRVTDAGLAVQTSAAMYLTAALMIGTLALLGTYLLTSAPAANRVATDIPEADDIRKPLASQASPSFAPLLAHERFDPASADEREILGHTRLDEGDAGADSAGNHAWEERTGYARLLVDLRPVMGGAAKNGKKAAPKRKNSGKSAAAKKRPPAASDDSPGELQQLAAEADAGKGPEPGATENGVDEERQLVVFRLAKELYGVDIATVREIIRMQAVTRVPNAREFVEGVINLRGKICPVIDLRKRFDVEVTDATEESRVVVIDIDGENVGAIVDAVAEVLRFNDSVVSPPSSVISDDKARIVDGIANLGDRLIMLVDLQTTLKGEESDAAQDMAAAA